MKSINCGNSVLRDKRTRTANNCSTHQIHLMTACPGQVLHGALGTVDDELRESLTRTEPSYQVKVIIRPWTDPERRTSLLRSV